MTKEELQLFYDKVTESPHLMAYLTLKSKLDETCQSFDSITIDVTSEDDSFKNLLSFSKVLKDILDDMDAIWTKIDPESQKKIRAEQSKAAKSSLEHYVGKLNK